MAQEMVGKYVFLILVLFIKEKVISEDKCCSMILLDVLDPESDVHSKQGSRLGFYKHFGDYGGKYQYK